MSEDLKNTKISDLTVAEFLKVLETKREKTYLSIRDVSEMFDTTTVTVYSWLRSGKIKSIRIGGRHMFDPSMLDDVIKGKHFLKEGFVR